MESPERPFNIGPLIMLTPPKDFKGNFANKLVKRMLKRPIGEPWNYRYVAPLVGLPHLEIVNDADPSQYVHRITLDKPGTQPQLFEAVCNIHSGLFDRKDLLWELYVIDGIEGGRVAIYGRAHHGILDGRTFVKAISAWFATSPKEKTVRAMWEGGAKPKSENKVRTAIAKQFAKQFEGTIKGGIGAVKTTASLYRMLGKQSLKTIGLKKTGLELPILKVPNAFSGKVTPERSFAWCSLPISEMKAFGKAHEATINDVLLASLDLAMARYLDELGDGPRKPLIADMPIALSNASGGNQIAAMQLPLGEPGTTPLKRLKQVCAETANLKHSLSKEANETVMLYTTLVHALPTLVERVGFKRGLNISNLVVSNPFGLPEERYLMGAKVEFVLPLSVVVPGQLLNVTAVTLADRLQIGFIAVPTVIEHVEKLASYTEEAFQTLQQAGQKGAKRSGKAQAKKKKARTK